MTVLIVSRVTPGLRGKLTRWMLQVHPGVFLGTLSARVRERLWRLVCGSKRAGHCTMIARANNEQGFEIMTSGGDGRASVLDFDGLALVKLLDNREARS